MKLKKHRDHRKEQPGVFQQYPVKRTINLAAVGQKPINAKLAAPGIVLVLVAALIFGKVAVADRIAAVASAQREAAAVKEQLDAGYQRMEDYESLIEEYAHVTYTGMTEEELGRVDRIEMLDLVQRVILPQATVSSWSIQENQMTLIVRGSTLQRVNLIVQQLEAEDMVDFCTVTTAATNEMAGAFAGGEVTAQVTIYLNNGSEEVE